jgi:hypothetical protein
MLPVRTRGAMARALLIEAGSSAAALAAPATLADNLRKSRRLVPPMILVLVRAARHNKTLRASPDYTAGIGEGESLSF